MAPNDTNMNITGNSSDSTETGTLSTLVLTIVICEAILMVVICCGNVLVIAAFYRNAALRTVTNFFILHLAVADTCVGATMPFHIYIFFDRRILGNIYVCVFRYSSITVTLTASVLFLLAIAVDRHVSIVHPLRYHVLMTQSRARIIVTAVWLSSIGFAFVIPMVWHNSWEDIPDRDCDFGKVMPWVYLAWLVPLFIINTLAILGLYGRIFYIAHERAHRIQRYNTQPRLAFTTNLKIAKTAAIVLGLFMLCWYPFYLITAIQVYGGLIYSETWEEWRSYATILAIANSAQNPVVYAFRMKAFRNEFKKLLRIKPSQKPNVDLERSVTTQVGDGNGRDARSALDNGASHSEAA
ncbi:octopamine receptor 1-like [Lingula anatina]|nr:octopamine receptor 1-like [Lingula anatina]|eukprot:XP_013382732.1 octopamine receptor 1-like [Lingula anatina]